MLFEAILKTSGPSDGKVRLFSITDDAPVVSGEVETSSATFVRLRTGSLTLAGVKEYKAQAGFEGGSTTTVLAARLIVTQSS